MFYYTNLFIIIIILFSAEKNVFLFNYLPEKIYFDKNGHLNMDSMNFFVLCLKQKIYIIFYFLYIIANTHTHTHTHTHTYIYIYWQLAEIFSFNKYFISVKVFFL